MASSKARIENGSGDFIEVDHKFALENIGKYKKTLEMLGGEETTDNAAGEPIVFPQVKCTKEGLAILEAIFKLPKDDRTQTIPKPLPNMTIETNFTEKERALLKRADDANQLPEMMEAVNDLEIENVQALLAAYIACRIDEISRAAPDIMSGAELLRTFLKIKNDWTEEEMGHLRKEMEYAKKMDPSVY